MDANLIEAVANKEPVNKDLSALAKVGTVVQYLDVLLDAVTSEYYKRIIPCVVLSVDLGNNAVLNPLTECMLNSRTAIPYSVDLKPGCWTPLPK